MIVQDVTVLPTFNPHGGPITHSSTGSKPDSYVHPLFPRLFLAPGLVCNSRATFKSDIRHNTYSRCLEPLSRPVSGNERLSIRLKLPMIPPYFALDIFLNFNSRVTFRPVLLYSRYFLKFNFESYFRHLPRCYQPDSWPCRGLFFRNTHPLFSHKYDGVPEERTPTSSWWPKQRNEDINVLDQPLREEQARMRRPARFVTKPSPFHYLLNLGTRFLVEEENCDARVIKLQWASANGAMSPRL